MGSVKLPGIGTTIGSAREPGEVAGAVALGRRRVSRAVVTLRPVLLALGLFAVGMTAATKLNYDPRDRLVPVGLQVVLAAGVALIGLLWVAGRRCRGWAADLTAAAASAFSAVVLAVALHGSAYGVGGLGISQANRTPAVARYMETWHLVDYSYHGLPAFYPPLMPWVVGRTAAFVGATPWHALKLAEIGMLFLAPLLSYLLWRRILPAPIAAFVPVVVAALVAVDRSAIFQPDAFLAMCVIVPWWLDAVLGLRRPSARGWPFWVHGIIGALIFCLYYYFFFPLALSLLLLPLLRRWHVQTVTNRYRDSFAVLIVAAVLSSVYWLRFLLSWIRAPDPRSLQNLWFTGSMVKLPVDIFDSTPIAVLMLAGLVHMAFTARWDRLSAGLLMLLVAGYSWYVIGDALAVIHKPVLVFRTEPFVELLMLVAGVRAAAAVLIEVTRRVSARAPHRVRDTSLVAAAVGLALAFVLGQGVISRTIDAKYVQQSHDTPLPNGELQPYASAGAQAPQVSIKELESVVAKMRGSGGSEPVVLSWNTQILKVSGMYAFNQWEAIYAHPAGEFPARLRFLQKLAATSDSERFATMARDNRFDAIDVFILRRHRHYLGYRADKIDFPHGQKLVHIRFKQTQFSNKHWKVKTVGPYFVATARDSG